MCSRFHVVLLAVPLSAYVATAQPKSVGAGDDKVPSEIAVRLEDLKASNPAHREIAAKELGKLERPAPAPVLRGLCAALVDSPKDTREVILSALEELAPDLAKPLSRINAV